MIDPRLTIVGFLSVSVWIGTMRDPIWAAGWGGVGLFSVWLLRFRIARRLPGWKSILIWGSIMSVLTMVLYWLFTMGDQSPVWDSALFGDVSGRTARGVQMALRMWSFVCLALVLGGLTTPESLAAGVTRLILPLRSLGVPVERVYYLVLFIVRMIPQMVEESQTIRIAQRSRGIGMRKGLMARIRFAGSLLIPVFASSLRRSERLSMALVARGFDERHLSVDVGSLRLGPVDYIGFGVMLVGWVVWIYALWRT